MAFFAQDYQTPGMQQFAQFGSAGVAQQEEMDRWDEWMNFFQPVPPQPVQMLPSALHPPNVVAPDDTDQALTGLQVTGLYASTLNTQREARKRLIELARKAGVNVDDPIALSELWQNAVEAARSASVLQTDIEPWDVLKGWAEDGAPGTLKREATERKQREEYFAEDPPDPFSITRTDQTVNLTDPTTARALITQMLRMELGREPSDDEIRNFTSALNRHERDNPTRTTTVEDYAYDAESGDVQLQNRDVTSEGGAGQPAAFGEGFIEEEHEPERDAFTAGTEYFNVMQSLTGSL